jgi:hypothetical protein
MVRKGGAKTIQYAFGMEASTDNLRVLFEKLQNPERWRDGSWLASRRCNSGEKVCQGRARYRV